MVTPRIIIAGFALLRGLHLVDGRALAAGLIGGVIAAVLAVATAGANELASILLALTVFGTVFGLIAGPITLLRIRLLVRGMEPTPMSRMTLALGALVGRTLVDLGLLGSSLLAASAIVRWIGPDGLVAVLGALVLAILGFIALRRLVRSDRVQGRSTSWADRLIGAPPMPDDVVGR